MSIRVIIACGGTGGHLFPGIAVAEELLERGGVPLVIISEKKIDALAIQRHEHLNFESLPSIGMPKFWSPRMVNFGLRILKSYLFCKKLLHNFEADAVLGMGGYISLAPLMAGRKRKVRTFVHESNAYPGKANRVAARWADVILLGLESCRKNFSGQEIEIVGTPLREVMRKEYNRTDALNHFGLNLKKKTLLVMGGSQGARGINSGILESLGQIVGSGMQVIHLTGSADYEETLSAYGGRAGSHYIAPFCHDMQLAYAASDLAIARSGASSLAELSAFGIPAILVPYPFATDNHQTLNAQIYSDAGSAVLLKEEDLNSRNVKELLTQLLANKSELLVKMRAAMNQLFIKNAAENICEEIIRRCK